MVGEIRVDRVLLGGFEQVVPGSSRRTSNRRAGHQWSVCATAVSSKGGEPPVPSLLLNPIRRGAFATQPSTGKSVVEVAIEAVAVRGSIPRGLGSPFATHNTKAHRDELRSLSGLDLACAEESMGTSRHAALSALCEMDGTPSGTRSSWEEDPHQCLNRYEQQRTTILDLWAEDTLGSGQEPGSRLQALRLIAGRWPWLFLDLQVVAFLRENELRLQGAKFTDIFPPSWAELLPHANPLQVSLLAAHAARLGWLPACSPDTVAPGLTALHSTPLEHEELSLAATVEKGKVLLEGRNGVSYAHVDAAYVAAALLTEEAAATGKIKDDNSGDYDRFLKNAMKRIRDQQRSLNTALLGPVLLPFPEESAMLSAAFTETLANPELDESDHSARWHHALRQWADTESVSDRLMTLVLGDPDQASIPPLHRARGEALRDALPALP